MNIIKGKNDNLLTIKIEGRLDTVTAPQLEEEINAIGDDVKELVFDMEKLEYVSSAGLRVILKLKKIMDRIGSLKVVNVNELVLEVFEITGFADILGL